MGKKIANGKKYQDDSEDDSEEDFEQEVDEEDEDDGAMEEEDDGDDYQSNSDILDNEDDSEGSEIGASKAGAFGSKKENYYKGSDVTDSDDSGEEEGADEIYREQQQGLTEADFMDEDYAKQQSEQSQDEDSAAPQDPEKAQEEEKERKQKLIKKLSPEIMSLAQEMNISLSEVIDKLYPILELEEAKKIMTGKGQNFLEIRYELLISYTMCILFYLLLKSKGKITNNHPVLDRLTKYKTHIERMNISLEDFESKVGEVIAKSLSKKKKDSKNAKKERPLTFEEKMKLNQKQQKKGGKETEQQKLARQLQEDLKNIYGIDEEDGFDDFDEEEEDQDSEENLLSEDEEDIRITKGAKAAVAQKPQKKAAPSKKKDDGEINMDSIEPWMLNDDDDEGDMLLQEPKKVDLNKIKKQENNKNKPIDNEEFEDDFYKSVKQQQHNEIVSKKQQRIQEKEKKKEELAKKYEIREIGEGEQRRVSQQIILNKGNLQRKRKSIDGNARVKNRMKFERKQKIHNRNYRGKIYDKQIHNYSGELGAIKSSVIKSTGLQ